MRSIAVCFASLLLFGCSESPEMDELEGGQFPSSSNIIFTDEDDRLFYVDDLRQGQPTEIVTTDTGKEELRITEDGERIAFLNSSGNPVIINRAGEVLETVLDYDFVDQIDWSFDSQTLYMLHDGEVVFHGPELGIRELIVPAELAALNPVLLSVAISPSLDAAYCFRFNGNELITMINRQDGSDEFITPSATWQDYGYLRYSKNGDLVIAYSSREIDFRNRVFAHVDLYRVGETSSFPVFSLQSGAESMPIFRSDLNFILFVEDGILRAMSLVDSEQFDVVRSDISAAQFDWK